MAELRVSKAGLRPSSPGEFCDLFKIDRPELDPSPILLTVRNFAMWRGHADWPMTTPDKQELSDYLKGLTERLGGQYAAAELAYLQIGAPVLWSVPVAGMIGQILRQSRCTEKVKPKSIDEKARSAIAALPYEWRANLVAKLSSEPGRRAEKWSANYVQSVAFALARWHRISVGLGREIRPCGTTFHAYAIDLKSDGVSHRSIADYLSRVASGYRVVADPNFQSAACDHVIARHQAFAKVFGRPTKTGAQIVGATTIFDLGIHLIESAREMGPRGLHIARDFRNGLLLAFAAALPQRARALSYLALGTTVMLLEKPYIHVVLPGRALKVPEAKKRFAGFDKVIENSVLWTAIDEYFRGFRPLFDDGSAFFPSMIDMGNSISSAQLGRLTGDMTHKHLGARVSIHRVRDNVATEASEELQSGGYLAPALIGNKSAATTMDSYDHAQGIRAAREHGRLISSLRSAPTSLRL